jgi:hypothetical protein
MDVDTLILIVLLIDVGVVLDEMLVENVVMAVELVKKLDAGNIVGREEMLDISVASSEALDNVLVLIGEDNVLAVIELIDTLDAASNVESVLIFDILVDVTFKGIAVIFASVEMLLENDVVKGILLEKLDADGVAESTVTLDTGVLLDKDAVLVLNDIEPDIGNTGVEFDVEETF